MTIELPEELGERIQAMVDSGRFASTTDAVTSGLDRLVEDDILGSYPPEELRAMIQEGIEAADRGDTVSLDEARAHIFGMRAAEAR